MNSTNMTDKILKRFDLLDAKLESISTEVKTATNGISRLELKLADLQQSYDTLADENKFLQEKVINLERKSWANEQYSRRECLEFSGIPPTVSDNILEDTCIQILNEIDVNVTPVDVDSCYRLNKKNGKVIVKFLRRKDCSRVYKNKKNLMNLDPEIINLPKGTKIFINDSLCCTTSGCGINAKC